MSYSCKILTSGKNNPRSSLSVPGSKSLSSKSISITSWVTSSAATEPLPAVCSLSSISNKALHQHFSQMICLTEVFVKKSVSAQVSLIILLKRSLILFVITGASDIKLTFFGGAEIIGSIQSKYLH